MTHHEASDTAIGLTMRAVRLSSPDGPAALVLEEIAVPELAPGEALIRVHAAALTKDELEWPEDRLPATPSYEVSGTVAAVAPGVETVSVGDAVYALTDFGRNGAAADYVAVAAELLAPKPRTLDDVQSAAIPLPGLSAWQGLFDHGALEAGQRVLITGAAGGVGHLATQLARHRGAHVIGTASPASQDAARGFGAHEVIDGSDLGSLEPVDVVFDTVGGATLEASPAVIRPGGRLVSVAEETPEIAPEAKIETSYFVVEPNREQLIELTRLAEAGDLVPAIDSVFPLADAPSAFERTQASGKRGKVVLRVSEDGDDV
jgi:NADPH:quinone reductase-like Zn-dependent oxidoreductase